MEHDANFNELYPSSMRRLAGRHWTPLRIAQQAGAFLADVAGNKILDIGSGIGKFCLAAASYHPDVHFFGIEQRKKLIGHARKAKNRLGIRNVSFLHGNFTEFDLHQYHGFYFFNPFFEHLEDTDRIDEDITYSDTLYIHYVQHLHNVLREMPAGTKIVTYHSLNEEIPRGYQLVEARENGELNFWTKQ
jgi:2-polyprenyl-3-methyl-5-hydroxy-6-metoxy-1,4-benzoquinol methylase